MVRSFRPRQDEDLGYGVSRISQSPDAEHEMVRPSKRSKRAKYASKACCECQRRKIKCDGQVPCRTCSEKSRICEQNGLDMRGKWRSSERKSSFPRERERKVRSQVEHRSGTQGVADPQINYHEPEPGSEFRRPSLIGSITRSSADDNTLQQTANSRPDPPIPQVSTFSGETSITHNLTVVEKRLEQMGIQYGRLEQASPQNLRSQDSLSPEPPEIGSIAQQSSSIRQIVLNYGLMPDYQTWSDLLHSFCEEVHILVPFLHLPTLWKFWEEFWQNSFDQRSHEYVHGRNRRLQAAHILLCLANGQCVLSSRSEGDKGPYSSGWRLYTAARDIFGDLLDGLSQCNDQLLTLQTVVLMVLYLFRLDALGPAEKILALSISHAHHIGLQRNKVVERFSLFESEMSKRLWWCIYLLDRRLAIESGRPFLIQDINVDVGLPSNKSDDWLTMSQLSPSHSGTSETGNGLCYSIVPYLVAMVSYSKVVGKVWEALYGAGTSESTPSPLLNEYLEHLIVESQRAIHEEFTDDFRHKPSKFKGLSWQQVKQRIIMRIRWSSLRLLIRKPMLQESLIQGFPTPETIQNQVTCMRVAQDIIDEFGNMPKEHPKYTFPFLHYLTNATIIALGLIIKQPSFRSSYGTMTLQATRSLVDHCDKTWVSRKMIRTVRKLNKMADAILDKNGPVNGMADSNSARQTSPFGPQYRQHVPPVLEPTDPSFDTVNRNGADTSANYRVILNSDRISQSRAYSRDINKRETAFEQPMSPSGLQEDQAMANDNVRLSSRFGLTGSLGNISNFPETETTQTRLDRDNHHESSNTHSTSSHTTFNCSKTVEPNVPFSGEMIDGGMEWLEKLFETGLDATLPPVWD